MQPVNNASSYDILKESPQMLLSLLNKYVKVELIKNTIIAGYVHSIDPIDHSIILLENSKQNIQTTIIPGHAILNLMETEADEMMKPPERKSISSETTDVSDRKHKLMAWFKENLLPVTECEENIIFGSVIILPPYNLSDICTDNPIVAMRLQNIMSKMPNN